MAALSSPRIAVIGLGYVGLPLAVEFGKAYETVGFDVSETRIAELLAGQDRTGEVGSDDLRAAHSLSFSDQASDMSSCTVYVITVPTPVDMSHQPNLGPLVAASETVGALLKRGDTVIYESTVFPGATEEVCLPILTKVSGLAFNDDFFIGYSPERVNPGDKERPITLIPKVTSGSSPEVARFIDELYKSIIPAGTFPATSIKVAEAAKIIENTQRDVNIALMNELSIVFSRLGIDTSEVIEAAATKWNFVRMHPGLVGGHCIGVDPYYLIHRAAVAGHIPDIIRISREINDGMARHAAQLLVRTMTRKRLPIMDARILVLGVTFKENCPDIRNTKVIDLVRSMRDWGAAVDLHDPHATEQEVLEEYGERLVEPGSDGTYHALVLAVRHDEFVLKGATRLRRFLAPGGVFFDMKAVFPRNESDLRL